MRLAALAAFLGASALRAPLLLSDPRFWGEEGRQYFATAYYYAGSARWYRGLTSAQVGYFSLWPNLATFTAANAAPLERAPLVTTLFALAAQLLPAVVVLWGSAPIWRTFARKAVCLAILLLAPLSGEIWLNSINSQFYLALAVFCLAVEAPPAAARWKWAARVLLLAGGLSGLASAVLLPQFAVQWWRERDRERLVQAAMLAVCAAFQIILLVLSANRGDETTATRAGGFGLQTLVTVVWNQSFLITLAGLHAARAWFELPWSAGAAAALLEALVIAGFLLWAVRPLKGADRLRLGGTYVLFLVVSLAGATGTLAAYAEPGVGQRYFYLPNVVLLFLLLANADRSLGRARAWFSRAALAAALLLGAWTFRDTAISFDAWPRWRDEVAVFRRGERPYLHIWPPPWVVNLKRYPD